MKLKSAAAGRFAAKPTAVIAATAGSILPRLRSFDSFLFPAGSASIAALAIAQRRSGFAPWASCRSRISPSNAVRAGLTSLNPAPCGSSGSLIPSRSICAFKSSINHRSDAIPCKSRPSV